MKSRVRTSSCLPESLESRRLFSASGDPTVVPIPDPTGAVHTITQTTGVTGEYFAGDNFQTPLAVRSDARINFVWHHRRPDPALPKGVFTARWTGTVTAPSTGVYTFTTSSDSGSRITINGATVIDNFTARAASTQQGTVSLTAGQAVPITVEYVSRGTAKGASSMKLLWSASTVKQQIVPQSALAPATGVALPANEPLVGSYYKGFNFKKLLLTRADTKINYNFGTGVPDQAVPLNTPFSVRWTGQITPPTTGTWVFQTIADDGVRLYINDQPVIRDWNVHSAKSNFGTIPLTAGQVYNVRLEYFQDGVGHGSAKLLWSLPGHVQKFVPFTAPLTLATPLNVAATPFSSSQINLTWTDVTGEAGYTIERSSDGGATFAPVGTTPADVTTFSDTGLNPLTPYVYEVIATNGAAASTASNPANATTLPVGVPIPSSVVAAVTASGTTATVSWTAVTNATSYLVERSPNGTTGWTSVGTTASTSLQDPGLANGTAYFYRVTSSNSTGSAAPSNVVSVTIAPAAPLLTATVASDTQVNLDWNAVAGATGYLVQRSANGTSGWTQVGTTPAGTTALSVPGLTGGTTYHFRVIAIGAGGDSAASNTVNPVTTAAPPTFASLTTIYGLSDNGHVYSIDTTDGTTTQIGTLSFGTNAAGRDPISGQFYYVSAGTSTVAISAWNPTNGTNRVISSSVVLDGVVRLAAFRDDGTFFLATATGNLYSIDRTTGTPTLKGNLQSGGVALNSDNGDLAFGPDNNMYLVVGGELYKALNSDINAANGGSSVIPTTHVGSPGAGNLQVAFGQNGTLFGVNAAGQLYRGNYLTAAAIPVGSPSGVQIGDLASVPLNADLSLTQTASTFTKGQTGTYTIAVANAGLDATVAPITVADTLPAGLSFVSGSGTGWTFSTNGSVVTLTYQPTLANGGTTSPATITVQVDPTTASPVVNNLTVATNIFDGDTSNNFSSLSTAVN